MGLDGSEIGLDESEIGLDESDIDRIDLLNRHWTSLIWGSPENFKRISDWVKSEIGRWHIYIYIYRERER